MDDQILLNEAALAALDEAKRPIFIFEWLRQLDRMLALAAAKSEDNQLQNKEKDAVRKCQKQLVAQLADLMTSSASAVGPTSRQLIANNFASLFTVGDTFLLFETINKCNDLLKNKDDSPSFTSTRLTSIRVLGTMYQQLGRMTGRSFEETVGILTKGLKSAESQTRSETLAAFAQVCNGLGSAASSLHRDLYKCAKNGLTDRALPVRSASASCLLSLALNWPPLYNSELEAVCQAGFKGLDGSNRQTRRDVSLLIGSLVAYTQQPPTSSGANLASNKRQQVKPSLTLEDALNVLLQGYIKGGSGGSGLMIAAATKSSAPVSAEVRVGVALSYISMTHCLGGRWLERNLRPFLDHVVCGLLSHPRAASTHVEAVHSRRCASAIIRASVGRLLGEKAQLAACKELVGLVASQLASDQATDQHVLVVALTELGQLMLRLGTAVSASLLSPPSATSEAKPTSEAAQRLLDVLFSVLSHSSSAPRAAAAWCLRCLAVASPAHLTPSIDLCLEGLENLRSSPEAVAGHSAALAALLGAVRLTQPLGIPHTRGKIVFNVGEELLRSASQNSRLSRDRTQAGWILIGSIMTLGPAVVKGLLPRMMLLWRNAFPRTAKELESEKARGDAFTWRVSLEARSGALASMHSFLQNSPDLVTDDILRRLTVPVEGALTLLGQAPTLLKPYANELRALLAMMRLRLFETLALMPPSCLEANYAALLRLLVSEFTLADGQSSTGTSLLPALCHTDDTILLMGTHSKTGNSNSDCGLEDQLLSNSTGAIEHDLTCLYRPLSEGQLHPEPVPLGVAVVDASILVFGQVFPRAAVKHRGQMLEHFGQHLKAASQGQGASDARAEAISLNLYAAILASLRGLVEAKAKSLGSDEVKKTAVAIVVGGLTAPNPIVRCAAAESLGRMAQVVGDPQFVAESAQKSFDCLKSARDVVSRTGHSAALGCLHRYVGGVGSSQHLHTSVSILLALAQDAASPQVQIWALHSLAMIADSGGPMFRGFVEPTLSTVLKLLLSSSTTCLEVTVCLGRLLSALITTVGPELQGTGSSIAAVRSSFVCACAVLGQPKGHPSVRAEAVAGLQQLHMFAPAAVDLASLVPRLCADLQSPHWSMRRAAVSCLRQFAQREASVVCGLADSLNNESGDTKENDTTAVHLNRQSGLPGLLFSLLDHEQDPGLTSNIHDTLNSIMHSMASENLSMWLGLCREVLTVRKEEASVGGQACNSSSSSRNNNKDANLEDDMDEAEASDDIEFKIGGSKEEKHEVIQPRWTTRVFAAVCLRKIIEDCCQGNRAHYDLGLAREMQLMEQRGDFLVLHLSELVRVAFMASTSDSDPLRLEGLRTLEVIIERFGETPEPEFPGHVILEQYQAQVGAALRPAFAPDTPSHVTAAACDVCSAWIGSGVARDLSDLRRVYQLLVTSLDKLRSPKMNSQRQAQVIFNESALTLEKLSILKAWAEVYVVSMKNEVHVRTSGGSSEGVTDLEEEEQGRGGQEDEFGDFEESSSKDQTKKEGLASLVQSELPSLSKHWLAALRDHALLSLPPEFKSQLPFDGGSFYSHDTLESARPHYKATWPPILQATAVWLSYGQGFERVCQEEEEDEEEMNNKKGGGGKRAGPDEINSDRFHLLLGICVEALANTRSADLTKEQVTGCLLTLRSLLDHSWVRGTVLNCLLVELCNVLHRTVLTREGVATQTLALEVLQLVLIASKQGLEANKKKKKRSMDVPANQVESGLSSDLALLGEGGAEGVLVPGKSVVFAALEVCLCVLVRHHPELSPRAANLSSAAAIRARAGHHRSQLGHTHLVGMAVEMLGKLPDLCSPQGAISVLPSLLWLVVGVARASPTESKEVGGALAALKALVTSPHAQDCRSKDQWTVLLQSTLQRLLDLTKTEKAEKEEAITNILMGVAIFLMSATPAVVAEAPGLKYPAVNAYVRAFQQQLSGDPEARRRCVQAVTAVLTTADRQLAMPLAQAMASPILDYLLAEEASREVKSEADLSLTLECVHLIDVLITSPNLEPSSGGDDRRADQLLVFLIPVLVSHLLPPEDLKEASRLKLTLHDSSLNRLTAIGHRWPVTFKAVLAQSEAVRGRLEAAARANQEKLKAAAQQRKTLGHDGKAQQPAVPSIKLTMDFGKKYSS